MIKMIFLGAPGAGKGTQAQIISEALAIPKLSTGDMLRKAISEGSSIGKKAKDIMDRGEFVSDEVVSELVAARINSPECAIGFILDGFPRNLLQAVTLDKLLSLVEGEKFMVFNLAVDEAEIIRRVSGRFSCKKCGASYHHDSKKTKTDGVCDSCGSTEFIQRPDDSADAVKVRLAIYKEQTMPLIDYYKKNGSLIEINGMQGIDSISASILNEYHKRG